MNAQVIPRSVLGALLVGSISGRGVTNRSFWYGSGATLLISIIVVGLAEPAQAVERFVPGQHLTLRAAMEVASHGDEIVVAPGVYSGSGNCDLDFDGKSLTIRGTSPFDPAVVASTVIDCQGDDTDPRRAFCFRSGEGIDSRLVGLTITGGFAPITQIGSWPRRTGGAILCIGSSPTIDRCVFQGNQADYGGAIACWGSSAPLIVGSTFVANTAIVEGAAVFARDSSPTVENCVFRSNVGTVISTGGTGSSRVLTSTLRENAGRGIRFAQDTGLIARCIFANNGAPSDSRTPSVIETYGSHVIVDNCLVDGNDAVGILSYGGAPIVQHTTLVANEIPSPTGGPIWIDTPDRVASIPGTVRGYWNDRLWSFQSRRLIAFDGLDYENGGLARPEHTPRRTFFNAAGAFLFSYHDGTGFLEKSPDGLEDFQTKLSDLAGEYALPRSLVYCGPTDEHAGGVMFYFEYTDSPRLFASTDSGENWIELLQCATNSIRHFHGAVFAPLVGANEGRLYVMTGDTNRQSSILVCDDIDDLIANPTVWRTRWGLDLQDERRIDDEFTINDNLDATGTPTSQVFRSVDMLMASDGYGYWTVDSTLLNGQSVHRVSHATKTVGRVGTEGAIGAGWLWLETNGQDKLFLTEVGVNGSEPKRGHDVFVHLYAVTQAGTDFVELRRWIRADAARPAGPTIPQYFAEAFGHLWISVTSGAVEYGIRNLVGRTEAIAEPPAPGIHSFDSALLLKNSVVWNNRYVDEVEDASPQIAGNSVIVRYSCVEGLPQSPAEPGNTSQDPRFISMAGL
ncbi:MAG: right-handed parallel beta-helix repeat-containing protein, partial [Planctomycetes bacterium]|nr:right-handed parallel beta-helix repeat-containing protein [Planctomycetota bacterium]